MASVTWNLPGPDEALEAEAYAMIQTMCLARDCGFRRLIFESDSERLIWMVKTDKSPIDRI
jgi:hypothetical protein